MTIKTTLRSILVVSALATAATAAAVPARPGIIVAEQPDGTSVSVTLHGDENHHWATTPDGFNLVRDAEGFFAFATADHGKVRAADLRYTGPQSIVTAAARNLARNIVPAPAAAKAQAPAEGLQTQIDGTFPTTGKRKLLMLLVNYADTKPTYSQMDFNNYMNAKGYAGVGSFRDFYLENSYGKLDITTTVTRWITLSGDKRTYGSEGAEQMILEALQAIDGEIDFRDFDSDGDGILDGLAVIHQGAGAEASSNSSDIWSHSGVIYGHSFDGVQLRRYTIQPEILDQGISTIGVMCHEFGHQLGAPDFYDTDYASSGGEFPGTGVWDLMASGAWNSARRSGDSPAGVNMWQKIQFGWATPTLLDSDTKISGMKPASTAAEAYRFNTTVDNEYFILENRQQVGPFDSSLLHHGLLVYHVNEDKISQTVFSNTLNISYPQSIWTVCAGATTDPSADPYSYGDVNTSACPWPGTDGKTSFTDTTLPSTRSISGRYSYKGLTNIAEAADGTVSFNFICYDMPQAPVDLTATARRGEVTLSWKAPEGDPPVKYNIYRGERLLATVAETSYTDVEASTLGASDLSYEVDAEYASGLVSPAQSVAIKIPRNFISELTPVVDRGNVTLTWGLDKNLTRMPKISDDVIYTDITCNTLETGHLFRADDLQVYRGYKIKYITFVPVMSPQQLKCTVTIYSGNPAKNNLKVLSQRELKTFGNSTYNKITLTKAVEITGKEDIFITVGYATTTGNVQFVTDQGPTVEGYGNLVKIDSGNWTTDVRLKGNNFFYAILSEPEADSAPAPEITPVEDAVLDNAFPLAFGIYRDGQLIATTGGRKFTDYGVPVGDHTYSVTNIYKGSNESGGESAIVTIDAAGIVSVTAGQLPELPADIFDIHGRLVRRAATTLSGLPAGIYIIRGHKIAL